MVGSSAFRYRETSASENSVCVCECWKGVGECGVRVMCVASVCDESMMVVSV
jgi:hypothetical protein